MTCHVIFCEYVGYLKNEYVTQILYFKTYLHLVTGNINHINIFIGFKVEAISLTILLII